MMSQIDNLAPHNVEAEEAVLGSILLGEVATLIVVSADGLTSQDFFIVRHQWIFEAMLKLNERHEPIDYLTVASELEQMGRLEGVGGAAYLVHLVNRTPSALNIGGYTSVVRQLAMRRRLIAAASEIAQAAHSDDETGAVAVRALEAVRAVTDHIADPRVVSYGRLLADATDAFQQYTRDVRAGKKPPSLPFPWHAAFERQLGQDGVPVLHPGSLSVVAAGTSGGKTVFLTQTAEYLALQGYRVLFVYYELTSKQMGAFSLARRGGVHAFRALTGQSSDCDWDAMVEVMADPDTDILSRNLSLYHQTPPDIDQTLKIARKLRAEGGLDLLVLDYLQMLLYSSRDSSNMVHVITEILHKLKTFAEGDAAYNVPPCSVLLASQFNRAEVGRHGFDLQQLYGGNILPISANLILYLLRPSITRPFLLTGLRENLVNADGNPYYPGGKGSFQIGKRFPITRVVTAKSTFGDAQQSALLYFHGPGSSFLSLEDAMTPAEATRWDLERYYRAVADFCQ